MNQGVSYMYPARLHGFGAARSVGSIALLLRRICIEISHFRIGLGCL